MRWLRRRRLRKVIRRSVSGSLAGPADDYAQRKAAARQFVIERLDQLNADYGFTYQRVTIRNTNTRWGSCSAKANLNFHYRLLDLPSDLVDYIVVHELCHLQHLNHSAQFWQLVARRIPDYQIARARLRQWRPSPD